MPNDLSAPPRDRLRALRRHAIAIGALIDDLQPQDITAWRPGDVAQINGDSPHAGALLRITRVDRDTVRGYLLASKAAGRDALPWARYAIRDLVRIGHAAEAIDEIDYPLKEKVPQTLRQYAEAARQEWIRHDAAKKAQRNARARARRAEKKAAGVTGKKPPAKAPETAQPIRAESAA